MFLPFLETLRKTSIVIYNIEGFYYLARTIMVKDEYHLDRFNRAFQTNFKGLENLSGADILDMVDIPSDWLEKMAESIPDRKKKPKSKLWAVLTS